MKDLDEAVKDIIRREVTSEMNQQSAMVPKEIIDDIVDYKMRRLAEIFVLSHWKNL